MSILKSLTSVFRSKHNEDVDRSLYRRRVFLVTSADLQRQIIDVMGKQGGVLGAFKAVASVPLSEPSLSYVIRTSFDSLADIKADDFLNTLMNWTAPSWLVSKGQGAITCQMGLKGAETIINRNKLYVTVPRADYVEKNYADMNCEEAVKQIRAWQPPAGLEEVHPCVLKDFRPTGFPSWTPPVETIEKCRKALAPEPV